MNEYEKTVKDRIELKLKIIALKEEKKRLEALVKKAKNSKKQQQ